MSSFIEDAKIVIRQGIQKGTLPICITEDNPSLLKPITYYYSINPSILLHTTYDKVVRGTPQVPITD